MSFCFIGYPLFQVREVVFLLSSTAKEKIANEEREPEWKVIYRHLVVGYGIDYSQGNKNH